MNDLENINILIYSHNDDLLEKMNNILDKILCSILVSKKLKISNIYWDIITKNNSYIFPSYLKQVKVKNNNFHGICSILDSTKIFHVYNIHDF